MNVIFKSIINVSLKHNEMYWVGWHSGAVCWALPSQLKESGLDTQTGQLASILRLQHTLYVVGFVWAFQFLLMSTNTSSHVVR